MTDRNSAWWQFISVTQEDKAEELPPNQGYPGHIVNWIHCEALPPNQK